MIYLGVLWLKAMNKLHVDAEVKPVARELDDGVQQYLMKRYCEVGRALHCSSD